VSASALQPAADGSNWQKSWPFFQESSLLWPLRARCVLEGLVFQARLFALL